MIRLTSLGHASVLIETETERILVDPWLTQRLDRFWEHNPELPDGLDTVLDQGVDYIIFSHHHFDHHHFPSLVRLTDANDTDFDETPSRTSEVTCIFPTEMRPPRLTVSGLGHQTIAWTLRRLGYELLRQVCPGSTIDLGNTMLRTFRSAVPFPEMSILIETADGNVMLCGDSILHESTAEYFGRPDSPHVDVAFIPAHSVSPPGVLTERRQLTSAAAVRARAFANFDRYVSTLSATLTIPSSFGWHVNARDDEGFSWCNKAIFPITPADALHRLQQNRNHGLLWGPGQEIHLADGKATLVNGPFAPDGYDFGAIYAKVAFDEATVIPPFNPASDCFGRQTRATAELLAELMERLIGSESWYRALDSGTTHVISVHDCLREPHGAASFLLEPVSGRIISLANSMADERIIGGESYTKIVGSTLQALLEAELLFESSYGLWVSNSNLLSAIFHHPSYYITHVEKFLRASYSTPTR